MSHFGKVCVSSSLTSQKKQRQMQNHEQWPMNQWPVNTGISWFFLFLDQPSLSNQRVLGFNLLTPLLWEAEVFKLPSIFPFCIDLSLLSLPKTMIFFLGFLRKLCSPDIFIKLADWSIIHTAPMAMRMWHLLVESPGSFLWRPVVWISDKGHEKPLSESDVRALISEKVKTPTSFCFTYHCLLDDIFREVLNSS